MKNTFLFLCSIILSIGLTYAQKGVKYEAVIIGKVYNPTEFKAKLINDRGDRFSTEIDSSGNFKFKIPVEKADYYYLKCGENAELFLCPDDSLHITVDMHEFDESLKFEGRGAEINNFIIKSYLSIEKLNFKTDFSQFLDLPIKEIDYHLDSLMRMCNKPFKDLAANVNSLPERFILMEEARAEILRGELKREIALLKLIQPGTPASNFSYLDIDSNDVNFEKFKGNYVLLNVYSSYDCGDCSTQFPYISELAIKYQNDSIVFLNIAIYADWEEWQKDIRTDKFGGIHGFVRDGYNSKVRKAYLIEKTPSFILIDPNGRIINPRTPVPSTGDTDKLISSYLNRDSKL